MKNQATYNPSLGVSFISDIFMFVTLGVKKNLKYPLHIFQLQVLSLDIPEAAAEVDRFLAQEVSGLPTVWQ